MKPASPSHLGYLDGIRAIAAIYVVAFHSQFYLLTDEPLRVPNGISQKLYSYFCFLMFQGHLAVTVFIMLSGFCLMLPVIRHGELRGGAQLFFKKRARRILPPYFASIAVSLALIWTLIGHKTGTDWDTALPVRNWDLVAHSLLFQDIFEATRGKINPVLWSISVEWRIYFLFPLFVAGWRKWGAVKVVGSAVTLSLFAQYALKFTPLNSSNVGICAHYVGVFALGMLACDVAFSKGKFSIADKTIPWGTVASLGALFAVALLRTVPNLPFYWLDMVIAFATFALLISLSCYPKGIAFSFFSWKPIAFLGTFAYSIYLIHAPILQLVHQYVLPNLHLKSYPAIFVGMAMGTLLSVIGAYLFFLCFERPLIKSKPSKLDKISV